jgi:uncharacterized protein (TIGR03083 family)
MEQLDLEPAGPFDTGPLFSPLHDALLDLLRGLQPGEWDLPTIAPGWQVRDVVAHLLDGDLRKLSVYRDGYMPPPPYAISSFAELTSFLNERNATWNLAASRLSPRVLIDLLEVSGPAVSELLRNLPPHERSIFPVSWAGETESENWLDVAREYTERWHHQMQIRLAVGADLLMDRRWLYPLLDVSMLALRRAYADIRATPGTAVTVEITGDGGGSWTIVAGDRGWRLFRGAPAGPAASIQLGGDAGWRLLFNALTEQEARSRAAVRGDEELAAPFFRTRAVMV